MYLLFLVFAYCFTVFTLFFHHYGLVLPGLQKKYCPTSMKYSKRLNFSLKF